MIWIYLLKTDLIIEKKLLIAFIKKKIKKTIFIVNENKHVKASWFGLPIILSSKINKQRFINKLENNGVETRPIISGNFLKQPSVKKYKLNINISLKNSDYINRYGFFIGLPTEKFHKKKLINW